MCPPNLYVENITPNATVFGERAFLEIIRVIKASGPDVQFSRQVALIGIQL